MKPLFGFILFLSISAQAQTFNLITKDSPSIVGRPEYLNSPYLTPGNRVYAVGHQNGKYPELGWHIPNEMGGIWNHPIKLMDGYELSLAWADYTEILDQAESFTNFPFTNRQVFAIKEVAVEKWEFVPDDKEGMVIQVILKNLSSNKQIFQLQFKGHTDLRPTWLGERTEMVDTRDEAVFDEKLGIWVVKDSLNPWYAIFGSNEKPNSNHENKSSYSGLGIANSLNYPILLKANETKVIHFVVAGSYKSETAAKSTYQDLQRNFSHYFEAKKRRYESLAESSKLTIPDKKVQQTFEWLKYNSDWMIRTVPEIGTGINAGIPDYPWWFGVDSEYALKGYMAIGQSKAVLQTIHLLDSLSEAINGNGRIVHEVSTNGVAFNKGNINEVPQFVSLIWEVYKWNGDKAFLKKYYPIIRKGLRWLMGENDANKNMFPDGFGMMEIHGLNSEMIDVAAYTQRAFDDASKIATELGNNAEALEYANKAQFLKLKINQDFWSEQFKSFADFIGTDAQTLELIDHAMIRADTLDKPWAAAELKATKEAILKNPSEQARPFVLYHNWVVNTPMEMKIADYDKAMVALNTAEKFVNPFGVFVTGIDRDESAGSDDGSFKGSKSFSYTGAVMTLPTGVLAVAENNYGRPNHALNYLKRMTRSFSYAFPGSMYEVSPDYGMISQAWNIYGFAVPIVQQFFGINPMASQKRVEIRLQMPDEWDKTALENVIVADNIVSIYYNKENEILDLKVVQDNPSWNVEIIFPKSKVLEIEKNAIQSKTINEELIFSSNKRTTELKLKLL